MDDDIATSPTRRDYIKYGGTVVGGGLLAGCRGDEATDSTPTTVTSTDSEPATSEDAGYSVSMEPVGEVSFDDVPETWLAMTGGWADMGIALGQDPPAGVTSTSRYHTHHYDDLPGVSVDKDEILQLYDAGIDKELFYELDVDLHVFDPHFLTNRIENIAAEDIDELATTVAPFFGNTIFSRQYAWHDDYRYYSLYEAFEKLAAVFRERERFEAFRSLHDEVLGGLDERIPPERERPSVALLMVVSEEPSKFYPFRIERGTGWKQWRDLGVPDGLDGSGIESFTASRGTMGYEALLDADPDYLLLYGYESMSPEAFRETFLSFFRDHETASELTAVREGNVYRAGGFYQGPIQNLALTERAAKQLYPGEFDSDERLFDRQRVADIVTGDF
ncbi:ABC transporter substrate-binding protein [Haloarcula salina]|uniref:ABC transporter substrate-binding protein n=1 Tax=Haloarcula salina TaxID=1429914 RepID=A0AA41G3B6_9EURY|nr:ABC transporter substrate-binding protein [Haloarcula salina]MBV0903557.1 ABC transporter substrate-binding protein [Haloarcula salina]